MTLKPCLTKATVEVVESDVGEIYLVGGKPLIFKSGDAVLPDSTLQGIRCKAPKIVVDMGAVPYVCKGATVMAPGILRYEGEFARAT